MALHNLFGALNLEATQQTILTAVNAVKSALDALNAKVTAVNTGAVTVSNQLTQPLTNTELRATAVPISGTVNTGLTQPLTDAQLRAASVPVSTDLVQPLTNTELRADAVDTNGISDWLLRRLARGIGRMSYDASNQLRVLVSALPPLSTVTTLVTMTTGNIGVGDMGKPATAMMLTRQLSATSTRRNLIRS